MDDTSHNIGYVYSSNAREYVPDRLHRALVWCEARARARIEGGAYPTPWGASSLYNNASDGPPSAIGGVAQ